MNTHQRWAAKMMRPEPSVTEEVEAKAAERERRRIRRLQLRHIQHIMRGHGDIDHIAYSIEAIKAATRAKRKERS